MQVSEEVSKTCGFHATLWKGSGEGGGYRATMPNDERKDCDSPPAILKKSLPKNGMLLAFIYSTVMQVCVACERDLQEDDRVLGTLYRTPGMQNIL